MRPMSEELVFTVSGAAALPAASITLAEAGLKEREHLQEWVLANPQILGSDVKVVTCEFDRWESRAGSEKDRLDILALRSDGHLVVAELKRDAAPDTVEMQAIKYAAMASRFDVDALADAFCDFHRKRGRTVTEVEAIDELRAHTEYTLSDETLRAPMIILIAGSFPPTVTATAVWLSEMGLDIKLTRVQAYRTPEGVVITVSQHYPPPDVEEFLVAPTRAARRAQQAPALPVEEWTPQDLTRLASEVSNVTIRATLDLCSQRPDEWVSSEEIQAMTSRETAKHRGDYGGFGGTIRARFQRSNTPFEMKWAAGGTNQAYYRLTPEVAKMWHDANSSAVNISPSASSATEEVQGSPEGT